MARFLRSLFLATSTLMSLQVLAVDPTVLAITDGTFTNPTTSTAIITMQNVSSKDVLCNVKVIGEIKGHDVNGLELTGTQASDAVLDVRVVAGRKQERTFDFKNAVMRMRTVWGDPKAALVRVDERSLTSDCRDPGMPNTVMCSWENAKVDVGQWLESTTALYRFCQCQPSGRWGNCTNSSPNGGACDWSNPDWSNPACESGGSKPCDWSNPDWSNPTCSG